MKCKVHIYRDWHLAGPEDVDAIIHAIDETGIIVTLSGSDDKAALPLDSLIGIDKFINEKGEYYIPGAICPVCGSKNVTFHSQARTMNPLGVGELNIEVVNNICGDCSAEGDFNGVNDVRIENAVRLAVNDRAVGALERLNNMKFSTSYIERCFGLNQGQLNKYTLGNFPIETYALLRLLELNPRILDIAKKGYNAWEDE